MEMELNELASLTHLANIYSEASQDLALDMYHDGSAGCEPLDATEIRCERFWALGQAIEELVTRELAGRTFCPVCRDCFVPAWASMCRACEAWEQDEYLDRRDDLAQEARRQYLASAEGQGDR